MSTAEPGPTRSRAATEERSGARRDRERREAATALAGLARQEALEAEPVDGQPADGQGGEHGAGPRHGGDAYVVLDGSCHQPVARVGDARHPGVGDQHDAVAGEQRLEQGRRAGLLVALEVGHDTTRQGDVEVGAQPLEPAGVLGRDDVRAGELGGEPGRCVTGLPDRGAREDQDASHGSDHVRPGSRDEVWLEFRS